MKIGNLKKWHWAILVFVGLGILGSLLPEQKSSSKPVIENASESSLVGEEIEVPTTTVAPTTTAATTTTVAATATTTTTTTTVLRTTTTTATTTTTTLPTGTVSQRNAVSKGASYLGSSSFSRSGLISQLQYEGFSSSEATYGTDSQDTDWNAQAAKKAASYLKSSSFSRTGLVDQLLYEGFTQAQAEYGVSTTGL